MKHPFWDRILLLVCALCAICGAGVIIALLTGVISAAGIAACINEYGALLSDMKGKLIMIAAAAVLIIFGLMLVSAIFPSRKKRSSTFAIQRNENGTVRISLKALETLVQKCLNQHAELKVVTSSLFSDEESVRVDVHINMQTDISMPLAISALQKQIKRYLEACSGVVVQEVRIFVEGTMPAAADTAGSPYALPISILGAENEVVESPSDEMISIEPASEEVPAVEQEPVQTESAAEAEEQNPAESAEQVVADEGVGE